MKGDFVMKSRTSLCLLVLFLNAAFAVAQQVGKINGQVKDAINKAPLLGANVIIEGTTLGAATDLNGSYTIFNIPPGSYNVKVSYIGYETQIEHAQVFANRETTLTFQLLPVGLCPPLADLYSCIDTCFIIRPPKPKADTLVIRMSFCNESTKQFVGVRAKILPNNIYFCGETTGGTFSTVKDNVYYGTINPTSCADPIGCAETRKLEFRYTIGTLADPATAKCLRFPVQIYTNASCSGVQILQFEGCVQACYHVKIPLKPSIGGGLSIGDVLIGTIIIGGAIFLVVQLIRRYRK
jgi:CarboxypepD_reg-like domain